MASFTCSCAAGWEGETCASNINDCHSDSCQNGGTCQVIKLCSYLVTTPLFSMYDMHCLQDGVNAFSCLCAEGYEGKNCENNTNDCDPNPCENGGTCQVIMHAFRYSLLHLCHCNRLCPINNRLHYYTACTFISGPCERLLL